MRIVVPRRRAPADLSLLRALRAMGSFAPASFNLTGISLVARDQHLALNGASRQWNQILTSSTLDLNLSDSPRKSVESVWVIAI
jgi:hypothetical protein